MHNLTLSKLKEMFALAAEEIAAQETQLSALDAVCGDGDHGAAIRGAITAAQTAVATATNLKDAFFDAGFAAMSNSNGSTSTLFGSLLMGISDGISTDELDVQLLAKAFESGLASVSSNTKANVGDKTLMDALIPAVKAMSGKSSVLEALQAAAKAADEGAKNTVNLEAKFGRAKNLGEKSKGSLDAGAVSDAIIFASFAKAFEK